MITVRSFLTLRQVMGNMAAFEMEAVGSTVLELLEALSGKFGEAFTNMIFDRQTHAISGHARILINGRNYTHLPDRLDTRLEEGDEVALFPPVAGG